MKKILYIFLVPILFYYTQLELSFAEPRECGTGEYCAIKSQTIAELDIYVENNKRAVNNIARIIRNRATTGYPTTGEDNTFAEYLVGTLTQAADWEGFDSLFDFYVTSAMEGVVPDAIYRDYEKLTAESDRIKKVLNMVSDLGYNEVIITHDELCDGVIGICSKDNKDLEGFASSLLGQIYQNNVHIKRIYRLSNNGQEAEFKDHDDLFFIPNISNANSASDAANSSSRSHFAQAIAQYYGANAIAECNQCNGGSYADISESIKNISQTLKGQSRGYKSWKDAWNLLIGGKEQSRKAENERILLQKELTRQGLSTESSKIILNNLDEYNKASNENGRVAGFTWGNNFISNTYNSFVNDTSNDVDGFTSSLDSIFYDESQDPNTDFSAEYTTIEEIHQDKGKIDRSILIAKDIDKLYLLQLEHAQKDDLYGSQLIGRMIDTHFRLVDAISSLDKARPIAERVCNSQAAGLGTCSFGNHK